MEIQLLRDIDHFNLVLELDEAVIYKHAPMCWAGMIAKPHVRRFAARHPEVPVFYLDAVAHRPLSRHVASALEIRHESPQVILLLKGEPVWNASHYRVTSGALERNLGRVRQPSAEASQPAAS